MEHSLLHQNLQSLGNAVDSFEKVLSEDAQCRFVCLTEHWQCREQLEAMSLRGFELASSYCRKKGAHGGSAVYVKSGITWKPRKTLERFSVYGLLEIAAVECILDGHSIIIMSVYRASNNNKGVLDVFFDILEAIVAEIDGESKIVIIAGDFNIEMVRENPTKARLYSLTRAYGLKPVISEYTRVSSTSRSYSESCLDNIFTNIEMCTGKVFEAHISDHNTQKLTFNLGETMKQKKPAYCRTYSEHTKSDFQMQLRQQDWQQVYEVDRSLVDMQWSLFINTFTNLFNHCFPLKLRGHRKQTRVVNRSVMECKNRLDSLLVLKRLSPEYISLYNSTKKEYDRLLMEAKRELYERKIKTSDNKNKTVWSVIKDIKGEKSTNRDCKIPGGVREVCEDYNKYILDVIPNLLQGIPKKSSESNIRYNLTSMFLKPVSPEEIINISKVLKNKHSSGQDGIPAFIVKLIMPELGEIMSYILNNSFTYGIFPKQLKLALVKPVFKKGDPQLRESYRPISLLNGFSKVFELVMCSRVIDFFARHNIFSDIQHGYLRGRSTQTAIYQFTESILDIIEEKRLALGMFLDLSKAFDCLDREILIEKLEQYGIRGNVLDWFKSYLSDRHQQVAITRAGITALSDMQESRFGVPQGSILGPILFVIFINDLEHISAHNGSTITCFADDTNIVIGAETSQDLIDRCSHVFSKTEQWFNSNGLILNREKTKILNFSTSRCKKDKPANIQLDSHDINVIPSTPFLGVIIDEFLRWDQHIESLISKLSKVCYTINFLSRYLTEKSLRIVYHSNLESLMRYGIVFYGSNSDVKHVFVTQKRAIRAMYKMSFRDSCRGVFRREEIMTVYALYIYECLLFLFKNRSRFTVHTNSHTYDTRTLDLSYPIHRLSLTEEHPSYMCLRLYNKLPVRIKALADLPTFRKEIKKLLIELEPYRVEDYFEGTF